MDITIRFCQSAFKHGITEADMTEEDADYWDDYYTKNTVMPDLGKPGFFARKYGMPVKLDPETTRIVADRAKAHHKTPAEIISEMVQEWSAAYGAS